MNRLTSALQRWFPPDSGDYVARNMPGYLQQRDALGSMPMVYQIGKPQYPTRSAAVYDEQAYRKIALVFRCINVIANAIGSAPIRVYDRGKDQQLSEIPDHPMRQLLERPNPNMGETVFIATISTTMAATGFCVIEKERAGAGRPVGLWPLRSDWLSPIPRSDGKADWHYKIPGRSPVTMPAEDVIVLTYASRPDYGLTGIGALEVALAQWSLLGTMDDFLKAFFDGGGQFSYGLLLADGATLKQDEADLLKKQWTSRFSSWRHGYIEPPILQTVKGIQRLGATFAEMEYVTMRDISEIAILQAFGVPGSLVGQRFAQERNTFTNYGEARTSFYQDTIIPLWARLDDAFTRQLLPEFDVRPTVSLQFDTSDVDALQEDQTALWTRAQAAMTAGGITRNEFRREIGLTRSAQR
jgi:HK97 family phage portal protein